jgi:hypothetical protein
MDETRSDGFLSFFFCGNVGLRGAQLCFLKCNDYRHVSEVIQVP